MKLIGRTLIILLAALAVVGATMALAGNSTAGTFGEGSPRQGFEQNGNNAQGGFQPPAGGNFEGRRGGRGGEGGGLFRAGELLKSLGVIGGIVLIVAPIAGLLRRRKNVHITPRQAAPPLA